MNKQDKLYKIQNSIIAFGFIGFLFLSFLYTTLNSIDSYKKAKSADRVIEAWNMDYDIDTNLKVNVFGKNNYLNLQGEISKIINKREFNGVIKLNNGYLSSAQEKADEDILDMNAKSLAYIQEYLNEKGVDFIYVRAPYKISIYDSELTQGVTDYSADNSKRFAELLEKYNINYIDIGYEMYQDGIDQYDYFYKTDHHWTPEAGIYAFSKINEEISKKYKMCKNNKYTNTDSYITEVYEDWYLGSNGQRVGVFYAGADDMHFIRPKDEVIITDKTIDKTAPFSEIMFDTSVLEKRDYNQRLVYDNLYGYAMGHRLLNNCADNDLRVLICSDSMGKVVVPYMVLSYREVQWSLLTKKDIDSFKPNVVIILEYQYNETTYCNDEFQVDF